MRNVEENAEYNLAYVYGELIVEPVRYYIEEKIIKSMFWFDKVEYYVACEFSHIGPFTKAEADSMLRTLNV